MARPTGVDEPAKRLPRLGTLRGTILAVAPAFDAPIEDFKESVE